MRPSAAPRPRSGSILAAPEFSENFKPTLRALRATLWCEMGRLQGAAAHVRRQRSGSWPPVFRSKLAYFEASEPSAGRLAKKAFDMASLA